MMFVGEVNFSNITNSWSEYALTGYTNIFGVWVYPLLFLGIVGYVYCISRSAITAAVAICLVFGVFGITGVFSYPAIAEYSMLSWVIVILSFAGLFTALFVRSRR
jgi:hypothetical protein